MKDHDSSVFGAGAKDTGQPSVAIARADTADALREEVGAVAYHLTGFREDNERLQLSWEIPARFWPLMGSLVGPDWGDGMGEFEINRAAADTLATAMGGNLEAHNNCNAWFVGPSARSPRSWKHEWLDLATRLERFADRVKPSDRVQELIVEGALALRSLLYADINGGLEDECADFPDPPVPQTGGRTPRSLSNTDESKNNHGTTSDGGGDADR